MIFDASKFGFVWGLAIAELRQNPLRYTPPILVAAAVGVGFDTAAVADPGWFVLANLVYQLVSLVIMAWVIGLTLRSFGHAIRPPDQWRIGGLFILSVLTTLGMALGLVALILPFFFLAGRWYVAPAVMLAEGLSATDAMRRSWHLLEAHWLTATLLFVIAIVGRLVPLTLEVILIHVSPSTLWGIRIFANILSESVAILSIVAAVCLYLDVSGRTDDSRDIFG